ncbi:MAG: hypothetical protein IPM53_10950 [Anaerolineaceae bacterium]|nr:hypothetical protein [Anaerolineaceae bacterium]
MVNGEWLMGRGTAEMLRLLGNAEGNLQPTWFIWDICPWLIETMPAMRHGV